MLEEKAWATRTAAEVRLVIQHTVRIIIIANMNGKRHKIKALMYSARNDTIALYAVDDCC